MWLFCGKSVTVKEKKILIEDLFKDFLASCPKNRTVSEGGKFPGKLGKSCIISSKNWSMLL
jgi:hypothetical protein